MHAPTRTCECRKRLRRLDRRRCESPPTQWMAPRWTTPRSSRLPTPSRRPKLPAISWITLSPSIERNPAVALWQDFEDRLSLIAKRSWSFLLFLFASRLGSMRRLTRHLAPPRAHARTAAKRGAIRNQRSRTRRGTDHGAGLRGSLLERRRRRRHHCDLPGLSAQNLCRRQSRSPRHRPLQQGLSGREPPGARGRSRAFRFLRRARLERAAAHAEAVRRGAPGPRAGDLHHAPCRYRRRAID